MNHFKALELASLVNSLATYQRTFQCSTIYVGNDLNVVLGDKGLPDIIGDLFEAERLCKELQFLDAAEMVALAAYTLETIKTPDLSRLEAEFAHALAAVMRDVHKRVFLYVETDRAAYVDQEALFGPVVFHAFPSARFDICEAGNCLAAECSTAAVFHLMRASGH